MVYEPNRGQRIWSVRDVDLTLEQGEFVGLVGESGCGKSTLGYALTRMLRPPARLENGVIRFDGVDISSLSGEELRRQRRNGFALVLQSGMNALNPVRTIEQHFGDILRAHARDGEDFRWRVRAAVPSCSTACSSTPMCSTASRTSSPAGCASASRSPWRWRSSRG